MDITKVFPEQIQQVVFVLLPVTVGKSLFREGPLLYNHHHPLLLRIDTMDSYG